MPRRQGLLCTEPFFGKDPELEDGIGRGDGLGEWCRRGLTGYPDACVCCIALGQTEIFWLVFWFWMREEGGKMVA